MGENVNFPKALSISLIFLWAEIHFIAVIYCILREQSLKMLQTGVEEFKIFL